MTTDVYGILAVASDGTLGSGSIMPWHHAGDFKRFAAITKGHGLLMGAKTYLGIIENYTKYEQAALPGRDIFLVGRYGGNFPDEEIRQRVVKAQRVYNPKLYLSDKNSPAVNIQVALERLRPDQKLFIAGGKSMYEAYLKYCDVIYATVIKSTYPNIKDPVKMEPETFKTLSDRTKYVISYDNQEFYNGLEAEYYVLQKIMTPTNQQVLPHQNYIP